MQRLARDSGGKILPSGRKTLGRAGKWQKNASKHQRNDAKFQQCELKFNEVTERSKTEKSIFETHCNELIKKYEFHQESEKQLRAQLSSYTEKYEEFQTTLKKSNQMFDSFKTEMDKMTKKIKKLEAETSQWKKKWEGCDKSLQSVLTQKNELEAETKSLRTKYESMEKMAVVRLFATIMFADNMFATLCSQESNYVRRNMFATIMFTKKFQIRYFNIKKLAKYFFDQFY
ncbi:gamma-taxilin isoform X1 [Brachionus plicatilis]|uniref:Gamma-taxilin isoform X1 n=1 Tax=Brachionus plicatilis TaxID=10195 RepID=A0A3M7Q6I0_BRAPC|nr:gamma-taxilin isoform X1 [Brachionus plicatilis]